MSGQGPRAADDDGMEEALQDMTITELHSLMGRIDFAIRAATADGRRAPEDARRRNPDEIGDDDEFDRRCEP